MVNLAYVDFNKKESETRMKMLCLGHTIYTKRQKEKIVYSSLDSPIFMLFLRTKTAYGKQTKDGPHTMTTHLSSSNEGIRSNQVKKMKEIYLSSRSFVSKLIQHSQFRLRGESSLKSLVNYEM
jgi:hypothetical protein